MPTPGFTQRNASNGNFHNVTTNVLSGTQITGQLSGVSHDVEAITAAKTLVARDSGKLFTITEGAANYVITLPTSPATGTHYSFVARSLTFPTFTVTISSSTTDVSGNIIDATPAVTAGNNQTSVRLTTSAVRGDTVTIVWVFALGWVASATSAAAGGIAFVA